jgi:hypothetical protein
MRENQSEKENESERYMFDAGSKAGLKHETIAMYRVLLEFAKMSSMNKRRFLSILNEFLMHSPQVQKQTISEWIGVLEKAEK